MWLVIRVNLHNCSWKIIGKVLNKTILRQKEFDKLFEFMEAVVWVVEVVNWSEGQPWVILKFISWQISNGKLLFQIPLVIYVNNYDGS